MKNINMIIAMDVNTLIGNGNKLPWLIPEELKHFRNTTINSIVIMGRKTFESINENCSYKNKNKGLLNRINYVISSKYNDVYIDDNNIHWTGSIECALDHCRETYDKEIFVIGGLSIYEYALDNNLIDYAYISYIKGTYDGDVYFNRFLENTWDLVRVMEEKDFVLKVYKK